MRRTVLILAGVALIAMPLPARAATYGVTLHDDFFEAAYRIIRVGDAVTWTNAGSREHTVTSFPDSPKRFSSSESNNCVPNPILGNDPDDCMDPGATFGPIRFDRPGTFEYYCKAHGSTARRPDAGASSSNQPCGMCGRIDVRAASTRSPGGGQTIEPSRTGSASPSRSPSRSASPSPSVSATASVGASPSPVGSGGSGVGRGSIALLGILILSGAGYVTWRRYIVPR